MNVIILAAGFSTRLYPLTKTFPKALLKVKDKPILNYAVEEINTAATVRKGVLITNALYYPHFVAWKQTMPLNFDLEIINNGVNNPDQRNGAIGDLALALQEIVSDDTLVLASDTLASEKLRVFIQAASHKLMAATMLIDLKDKAKIARTLGCAKVNPEQVLIHFEEKPEHPQSTLAAIPYYYFPKKILPLINDYLSESSLTDAPGSLLHWLINKTPVYGHIVTNGYYYDIGTQEALEKANKLSILK